jgi:hypothetical protein
VILEPLQRAVTRPAPAQSKYEHSPGAMQGAPSGGGREGQPLPVLRLWGLAMASTCELASSDSAGASGRAGAEELAETESPASATFGAPVDRSSCCLALEAVGASSVLRLQAPQSAGGAAAAHQVFETSRQIAARTDFKRPLELDTTETCRVVRACSDIHSAPGVTHAFGSRAPAR